MFILGLTGSIGMGKTTTAELFRKQGVPVHDADAVVHALYEGEAVAAVEDAFPGVTIDGVIDRGRLGALVRNDPQAMRRLEALIHPLVRKNRADFIHAAARAGRKLIVLDIPLLFEVGADREVDATVVVSAPEAVQKERVSKRPGMTPEWLAFIMSKQMPDSEKRRRAHFIIDTSLGLAEAERQVRSLIRALAGVEGKHHC